MVTHIYKSVQLTGIMLCALALVLSSCKDSALREGDSSSAEKTTAQSASGATIEIANSSSLQDVYWTGKKDRSNESILAHSFVNEQGDKQTNVLYRGDKLQNPFGVAVDLRNDMMYWTDDAGAFIARAPIDGNGSVDTLYTGAEDGVSFPGYLSLNLLSGELIWADEAGILKGSLDGSAPVDTVYSQEQGVNISLGTDLLLLGDLVYWTELGDNEIVAGRLEEDKEPKVLFNANDASPALSYLFDLQIDLLSGRLYVSDGDDASSSRILRGRLDGQDSLETIYKGPEDYAAASSLAIDQLNRKLYWSQTFGADFSGTILHGPLDGNGTPELAYDLRDFEGQGIDEITSVAIAGPLGLKGKNAEEGQQEVIYLYF